MLNYVYRERIVVFGCSYYLVCRKTVGAEATLWEVMDMLTRMRDDAFSGNRHFEAAALSTGALPPVGWIKRDVPDLHFRM